MMPQPSLAGATLHNGHVSDVKSVAPDRAVMRSESDEMLANEIGKRIRQYVYYTIYDDVEGSVQLALSCGAGVESADSNR
jgi:hypothetical protein